MLKVDLILPEREILGITYDMLATDQKQEYKLTRMLFLRDDSDVIMILGPPGSRKSTTIHSITKIVDDLLHGSMIFLGTTETDAFIIAGSTRHSTLCLPINRQLRPLQGSIPRNLQECFAEKK